MIAIKDMKMPEYCGECKFCKEEEVLDSVGDICELLNSDIARNGKRDSDCPLVEITTCDDCVSRRAVLDALDKNKYSNEFCEEHHIDWSINLGMAHIVVNKLKPVTPTQKWIPVSERLPEEDGEYLCTVASVEDGFYLRLYDYYAATHKFDTEEYEYDGDVLAWMPIPKPYKPESEEKE